VEGLLALTASEGGQVLTASIDTMGWDELGVVCEGIAYASRLLRAATWPVTRQYSLGPRGAFILNLVSLGARYPLDLANAMKCGRSLITAELTRLTDAGLIVAKPGEKDRRRSELALTAAGEEACQRVRREMERLLKHTLAAYSPDEVRLFSRMLRDVRQIEANE
jgi:DNA-binding MarR family transcriptional regulator